MTDRNPKSPHIDLDYECIEESLGQNLWRLDDPESKPE